jgi:CBS domain-containing protein
MSPTGRRPAASPAARSRGRSRAPGAETACSGWERLVASDVMRRSILFVSGSEPLSEVERFLFDNRISGAPVTDATGKVIGVVTLRDLIERYTEDPDARPRRGAGWFELPSEELYDEDVGARIVTPDGEETAADVMTAQVHRVACDATLLEVAAQMTKRRIHRILVEEGDRIVGVIGTFEILGALSGTVPKRRASRRPRRAARSR